MIGSGAFFVLMAYVLVQQALVHGAGIFALALVASALTVVVLVVDGIAGRSQWLDRNRRLALVIGVLAVLAMQLLYVREIYSTVNWDPRSVFAAAIDLAGFKQASVAQYTPGAYTGPGLSIPYWSAYPNNLMLAFVYEAVFRFCAAAGIPSAVYLCTALNVVVVDIAILLAARCAGKLWGGGAERITLLVAIPFLGFSPWISVAYSDTIATVFPVLMLYLYMRYVESTRTAQYVIAAAIAATTATGYLFKPHVVAMALAIGVVHALSPGSRSPWRVKLVKVGTIGLVMAVIVGGAGAYRDYRLQDRITKSQFEESRFPVTHWIAMSLNDEVGGFNGQDVDEQRALIGLKAKNERNLRVIRERLSEMGPFGYAAFLHRKLSWMSTDGTFYWQLEGALSRNVPFHDGAYARKLQSVVYRDGKHFHWFEWAANAAWIAVLAWLAAPLFTRRRCDADRMLLVTRLAIVALVLMLLVLEGRSRYLISFMPVFVMLGSYFLAGISDRWSAGIPTGRAHVEG